MDEDEDEPIQRDANTVNNHLQCEQSNHNQSGLDDDQSYLNESTQDKDMDGCGTIYTSCNRAENTGM